MHRMYKYIYIYIHIDISNSIYIIIHLYLYIMLVVRMVSEYHKYVCPAMYFACVVDACFVGNFARCIKLEHPSLAWVAEPPPISSASNLNCNIRLALMKQQSYIMSFTTYIYMYNIPFDSFVIGESDGGRRSSVATEFAAVSKVRSWRPPKGVICVCVTKQQAYRISSVSYTHLTLPTKA